MSNLLTLGTPISGISVSQVTADGFFVLVQTKKYFLSFDEYPWFRDARTAEIMNVKLQNKNHLRWSDLDVDLDLDSLEHPERYPLCFDSSAVDDSV